MASIINVDQIRNAAGTSAITIDSSGNTLMPGHVVQVVQGIQSTYVQSSSTSYVASNLSQAITPRVSGSKVLITLSMPFTVIRDGNSFANLFQPRLIKDGSTLVDFSNANTGIGIEQNSDDNVQSGGLLDVLNYQYLDTTTGTSAITYSVNFACRITTTGYVVVNGIGNPAYSQQFSVPSTLTLMEIAQ